MRVLLYCGRQPDRLCSISEIAHAYEVSLNNLMKICNDLTNAGFLTSVRGRHGGIRLARPATEINVGEVIRHAESDFDLVECGSCLISPACGLASTLEEALAAFMAVLNTYSLADLIARKGDFGHLLRAT